MNLDNSNGNEKKKNFDVFAVGVVEHSGKAYWTYKIGWMLVALCGVLSLGSAVLYLAPSVSRLTTDNQTVNQQLTDVIKIATETQEQLQEAKAETARLAELAKSVSDREECRNRYNLAITNARTLNTISQNNFIISLAGQNHTQSIEQVAAELEATNAALTNAMNARNAYEADGALTPCPLPFAGAN